MPIFKGLFKSSWYRRNTILNQMDHSICIAISFSPTEKLYQTYTILAWYSNLIYAYFLIISFTHLCSLQLYLYFIIFSVPERNDYIKYIFLLIMKRWWEKRRNLILKFCDLNTKPEYRAVNLFMLQLISRYYSPQYPWSSKINFNIFPDQHIFHPSLIFHAMTEFLSLEPSWETTFR